MRSKTTRAQQQQPQQQPKVAGTGAHSFKTVALTTPLRTRAPALALGLAGLLGALLPSAGMAQATTGGPGGTPTSGSWQFGAVVDASSMSQPLPLGLRDKCLGLGHSDLLARGTLGRHFSAEGVAVFATEDGRLEKGIEKLFIQTRTLPGGLQARAGRFASQVGYLNEQHPHADDFVERPPLYRAILGQHYFDDGLRLNWTAPTPFFLQLGAEAFRGRKLSEESPQRSRLGVGTLTAKFGADIGANQAWQAGVSLLNNRRAAAEPHEMHADAAGSALEAGHAADDQGQGHEHGHGAAFTGRRLTMLDLAWKWAPRGNPRDQQVRLVLEHARLSGLQDAVLAQRRHEATSLSLVWRFRPDWEAGLRTDRLRAAFAHEDHADAARLNEQAAMLVYKPSHKQSLRLQWTTNRNPQGFEMASRRTFSLQYVVSFGAHGAHNF